MAIDTDNEKLALIEYGDIFQPGIPISADGLDQADNQQLLWEYPGILWSALAATAASAIFETDNASPPSTETAKAKKDLGAGEYIEVTITALIKAGDYYRLREEFPTVTITNWIEYNVALS